MLEHISVLVMVLAVLYFSPDNSPGVNRRAPVPVTTCREKAPVTSKCINGNALAFYSGPSDHTIALLNAMQMLQIKATFFIETQDFTDWSIVNHIITSGHGIGFDLTRKYTTDIMSAVNADKLIWLANVGVVPKFVTYTNTSILDDAVNEVLLSNNYYPTKWSLDPVDYNNTQTAIQNVLATAANDVIVLHQFAESNFTETTLSWFFNNTESGFNTLQSCFGTNSSYWSNCSSTVTAFYAAPSNNPYTPDKATTSTPSKSPTPADTPSAANRFSWIF